MVPQTQITDVRLDAHYAIAHQCGPTYTGPTGGYYFVDGLLSETVPGYLLRQNGMANMTSFWEARPGHELAWVGDAWVYAPARKAAKVAPPPVPMRPTGKRKRGKG